MTNKDATPLEGKLNAFFETGTEGIIWMFEEAGKTGYDALHLFQKGDFLRVFNNESEKKVIFEGPVDLIDENQVEAICGLRVHGHQRNEDPEKWAKMFFEERPAQLILRNTL